MSEQGKIYFISDIHLGAPAFKNNRERERLFARWLDEIKTDVAELYLMGDIFDFWYEYKKVVPRGFTRILGRIADMTDNGIPVYFFPGNHDLWVFDYLPQETGVVVHRDAIIQEIRGRKFFLAHGDGIDPSDKGYLRLKKIFTNKTLQWLFSRLHPNFAFFVAHKWSESSRLAKIDEVDEFKMEEEGMYKFAVEINSRENIDYFVFGHRHTSVDIQMPGNARFILLGDWINNFTYGVFDGNNFEIKKYNINKEE